MACSWSTPLSEWQALARNRATHAFQIASPAELIRIADREFLNRNARPEICREHGISEQNL